ncbi:MAG TPA: protein kinase, partial [Polyangiaceae bacterium]|nr:protein kinase [Polyangiaceae bacterium]
MEPNAEEDAEFLARIGSVVDGKWRLEKLLGSGGMAAVYEAQGAGGVRAAVKILHPEMARKKDVRERFVREAYVANQVGHTGAVAVLEHGAGDEAYLVMELLEGEPRSTRVKRQGLTEDQLLDVLDQVLDVLAVAHTQGIIHRDIKPDNLFLCNDGRVEVLDFGLARMIDEVPGQFKTRTGLALGTVPYMPPEQALGRRDELDGRADLFSLGASAFRILTGQRVHEAPSEAELLVAMATKPVQPLASVAPHIRPEVCAIIDLSLAFSRDARYPDAQTMQADVRAARGGQVPPFAVGQGVQTSRDAPTRVDMVAPAVSARFAPAASGTVPGSPGAFAAATYPGVDAAPASVGPQSASWQHGAATTAGASSYDSVPPPSGYDAPPASGYDAPPASGYDAPPMSAGPASLQYGVPVTASAPPPKRRGGLVLLVLAAVVGALLLGVVGVGFVVLTYGGDALQSEDLSPGTVGVSPLATPLSPNSTESEASGGGAAAKGDSQTHVAASSPGQSGAVGGAGPSETATPPS